MIACEMANFDIVSLLLSNSKVKTQAKSRYHSNCIALSIHSDKTVTERMFNIINEKLKKKAKIFQLMINIDDRGWDCLFYNCKYGLFDSVLTEDYREMFKEKNLINRRLKQGYNIVFIIIIIMIYRLILQHGIVKVK